MVFPWFIPYLLPCHTATFSLISVGPFSKAHTLGNHPDLQPLWLSPSPVGSRAVDTNPLQPSLLSTRPAPPLRFHGSALFPFGKSGLPSPPAGWPLPWWMDLLFVQRSPPVQATTPTWLTRRSQPAVPGCSTAPPVRAQPFLTAPSSSWVTPLPRIEFAAWV